MIYNRDESEVTVLGEIEKHNVSIDARNINHIVTILSSNLYSYPMISFLRETVSNAVDSHVEAGVNEPIIITRTADDISIRDFGTGISPERFENIYLNIGSSTKRESNDYIGSFGIGRFSCLSVSKLANITSFYNGKAYYYVMNMDIDQLHIDKIYELDTTEHNGVEVKIPLSTFNAKDLDCLSFIENVYVECDGDRSNSYEISEFNKRKIHAFNNFKTITYEYRQVTDKTEVLLGKIPYAVDYMSLWDYNDDWHRGWKETMRYIYPCINIGEVDITPNRETLIYTDRTKAKLKEVYEKCIQELTGYWNDKCDVVFDNFFKWADEFTKWRKNTMNIDGNDIPMTDMLPFNAKYQNHPEWDNVDPKEKKKHVQALMNMSLETLGIFDSGTIYKGRRETSISFKKLLDEWIYDKWNMGRKVCVLPSQTGFSSKYFKDFLYHKYGSKKLIFLRRQRVSSNELRSWVRRIYGATMLTDTQFCPFVIGLLKEAFRTIRDNSEYTDIMSSPEYHQFKKENQNPKTYVARHTGKINFTIINTAYYNVDKRNVTIDELLQYIKQNYKEKQVVYASLDSPFLAAFHKIGYPNLLILSAAKNNMKYLEEGLPEWIKPIETLYTPDNRVLIKYKTAKILIDKEANEFVYRYHQVMPEWVKPRIEYIRSYLNIYNIYNNHGNNPYVDPCNLLDIIPEDVYDPFIVAEVNVLRPYLILAYKIDHSLFLYGSENELAYYLLMKSKKLRPNFTYYTKIRERVTEILNLL